MNWGKNCFFLALAFAMYSLAFSIKPQNHLNIQLAHYVGNTLLQLDSAEYKNELNQSFIISKFKYYIGNIQLVKKDGTSFNSKEYYLINEEEESSKNINLENIPDGEYQALKFTLGVDSIDNCSGLQHGALDPVNAMFWAWNTGYIFLKLEGYAAASKSPGHIFEYHIGGFREPDNCIRTVFLPFEKPLRIGNHSIVNLKADVAEILKSPTSIDFSKTSSVTDFHNATMIADNYADMFRILRIDP